jgi:ATPase subunit of ABC transporter with duplicated ATPase domains
LREVCGEIGTLKEELTNAQLDRIGFDSEIRLLQANYEEVKVSDKEKLEASKQEMTVAQQQNDELKDAVDRLDKEPNHPSEKEKKEMLEREKLAEKAKLAIAHILEGKLPFV